MSEEKKQKKFLKAGCLSKLAIVAVTVTVVLLLQTLPAWLSGKLLPALAESAGVAGLEANVTSLGFDQAELRNARVRIEGRRSVSVNTIRVKYQLPFYPFQKRIKIKSLEITGLRINVVEEDGQWTIPGIYPDLFQKEGQAEAPPAGKSDEEALISLQRVNLRDCEIRIERDGQTLSIPFAVHASMPQETEKAWRIRGGIQFAGDKLDLNAEWNRHSGGFAADLKSDLRFGNYGRIIPALQGKLFGSTKLAGKITGTLKAGGNPSDIAVELIFDKLAAGFRPLAFSSDDERKFTLKIAQLDRENFAWEIDGLEMRQPVKLELTKSGGNVKIGSDTLIVNGKLGTEVKKQLMITRDLPLAHEFDFAWQWKTKSGEWHYRSAITESGWENTVNSKFKRIDITSAGSIRNGAIDSDNKLVVAPELELSVAGQDIKIAEPAVQAKIGLVNGRPTGTVELGAGQISVAAPGIQADGLNIRFPLTDGEEGLMELNAVKFRNYELEQVYYKFKNLGNKFELAGGVRQNMLPSLICESRVTVNLSPELTVEAGLEIRNGSKEIDLGQLLPALKGMRLNGDFSLAGKYDWSKKRHGGSCDLLLRNGALVSEPLKLAASGIELGLNLPELPVLKTDVQQRLVCKELKFKGFVFENIEANFALDRNSTFALETFRLNWCGGNVFTYAVRFTPGDRNVAATVYFNGLNVSQIIGQTGLTAAEGDGAIFGRLPLTVGKDGIQIQPGYLYSVPGETKNIKFTSLKNMLAAIPPGTPQYNQLDLATEALKDFNYDWIKVDLRNEGDKLVLASQFNGRPVNMLPFAYDDKSGGMVRVEGAKANFQGIKLDLNTSVPLNQLLKFNSQIQKLFGGEK